MKKLLLATKNKGKLKEVQEIFKDLPYEIISLEAFDDHDDVVEDGFSFKENAIIKAEYYQKKYHIDTIADDSGISIVHLLDHPNIHSARFLGGNNYDFTNQFVIDVLDGVNNRDAYYTCVIAYANEFETKTYDAYLNGQIATSKRGSHGFGFDPIFYIPEYDQTLAEMEPALKNQISHRFKALEKLVKDFEK